MKNIIVVACCRSGHNFVMNQIRSWGEFVLVNFEDCLPADYQKRLNYLEGTIIDTDLETMPVIVMRDLLNWWASYLVWIKSKDVREEKMQYAFDIWTQQAMEAIDATNHIENKLAVSYDGFKVIPSIRQWLCNKLGGNYSEELIDVVPEAGSGSSFDNLPGSQMQTHLRYQQVINSTDGPFYLHMLSQNKRAMDIYLDNFEPTADQRQICQLCAGS